MNHTTYRTIEDIAVKCTEIEVISHAMYDEIKTLSDTIDRALPPCDRERIFRISILFGIVVSKVKESNGAIEDILKEIDADIASREVSNVAN